MRGALWTIVCSIGTKLVTLAGQLVAAWFLVPADFGVVAVALSITCVGATFVGTGVRDVLIQRKGRFNRDASEAFWLSLVLNTAGAVLLGGLSPLAAVVFHEPRLVWLIAILVLCWPLHAFHTIYVAALYRGLRFRTVAAIRLLQGVVHAGGVVVMATTGFGAYSLVLPNLLRLVSATAAARMAAGPVPIRRPHPGVWPGLLGPTLWLMLNAFLRGVQYYGPSFAVGLVRGSAVTGICFWGLQLASQTLLILATNLKDVLFPTLTRLNGHSRRQYEGVRRACRALMIVIAPICVLQMLLAAPLIKTLFPGRWLPAVDVVVWLSAGMITQPLLTIAASLLMARGEYRLLNLPAGLATGGVMAAAFAGAVWGGPARIALCMGAAVLVSNMVAGWVAFRRFGRGWEELLRTIACPVLVAVAAGAGGWLAGATLRHHAPVYRILIPGGSMLLVYAVLLCRLMPGDAAGVLSHLKRFRSGRRPAVDPPAVCSTDHYPG